MHPDRVKEIKWFQKVCVYLMKNHGHTIAIIAKETKLSAPTIQSILSQTFDKDSSVRSATVVGIQDFLKIYNETKNFLAAQEYNHPEGTYEVPVDDDEEPVVHKKEKRPYVKKAKTEPVKKIPVKSEADTHESVIGYITAFREFEVRVKKLFPDSEISVSIKVPITKR